MLRVRFFIFLAFAALCFGEAPEGDSDTVGQPPEVEGSPGGTSQGSSDPGQASGVEGSSGTDSGENKEAESSGQGSATDGVQSAAEGSLPGQKPPGFGLPDFIGDNATKRSYVDRLAKQCGDSDWKVNEKNITRSLQMCTYTCEKKDGSVTTEKRIPVNMTCGTKGEKCQATGECPVPTPLPNC
uniref:Putative ixodes 8-cys protein n=1 Tax=Ixodes ricinus TaxID=34613 RepID=A0A0K8RLL5_IXORI